MLNVLLVMTPTGDDDRPSTADLEVMRVQNGGGSPVPSIALTDTDFGGHGEPETGRSTLLRSALL